MTETEMTKIETLNHAWACSVAFSEFGSQETCFEKQVQKAVFKVFSTLKTRLARCNKESFDASELTMEHSRTAIRQVHPSDTQSYQELSAKFQRLIRSYAKGDGLGYQPCSRR
ncbi:hypothetical protein L1049_008285 [Liquidambar formosana]|uniref:Uncharacterized protein n=1 Tax=Liquidambar formosana TaxID=63359 RepID=A0AAP0S2T3_LIQFO